jgi:hypothetical protein
MVNKEIVFMGGREYPQARLSKYSLSSGLQCEIHTDTDQCNTLSKKELIEFIDVLKAALAEMPEHIA